MIKQQGAALCAALAVGVMLCGTAQGAAVRLGAITDHVNDPVRVAVDSQGKIYVTETKHNRLHVYDRSNYRRIASIRVSRPLGVAVGPDGRIYVGSEDDKRVFVFGPDYAPQGSLPGEVSQPNAVATTADGRVYVVESGKDRVLIYEGGRRTGVIGSTGSGNGEFTRPLSIAVNEPREEIFVSDLQLIQSPTGELNGARIQVFDKSGNYKRSFGRFGVDAGQIAVPAAMALDKSGTLYVVDLQQGVAHILDPETGASLGGLFDPAHPLAIPLGIAITKNNLAYIACNNGKTVEIYGLDGYTAMETGPAGGLAFTAAKNAAAPAGRNISITNSGSGTLNWSAAADKPWIVLGQSSGTTAAAATSNLAVSVSVDSLAVGAYGGAVTITSDYGHASVIPVSLTVLPPARVSVSSGWLAFSAKKGGPAPPAQTVTVATENSASETWSIVSDSAWLSVNPASGVAAAQVTVSVNPAGLTAGTHTGTLTLAIPGSGAAGTITVTLELRTGARIRVSANHPDASYVISGPNTYSGRGMSATIDDAPAGEYAIVYGPLAGYRRPPSQTKTLVDGGEALFSATYQSHEEAAARRTILAARKGDGLIKAYKNTGAAAGFELTVTGLRKGQSLATGDVDGDGTAEIIAAVEEPAQLRVYRMDKSLMATLEQVKVIAVSTGDLDGDGKAEVLVASQEGGAISCYSYDEAQAKLVSTGIELAAGATSAVIADLEGDQRPEIVTSSGAHLLKIWTVDLSGGRGSWSATQAREMAVPGAVGSLAAGNADDDPADELVISTANDAGGSSISVLESDGTLISGFKAFEKQGAGVAAADLDGDGKVELVLSPVTGPADGAKRDKGGKESHKQKNGREKEKESGQAGGTAEAGLVKVHGGAGEFRFTVTPFESAAGGMSAAVGECGL